MAKKFHLAAADIRPIVRGQGACIATDRIMVDGAPVGYMYREPMDRDGDSGWRFMAGDESQAYMDDAANHGVYDVNTVANSDGDIVQFLSALPGARFARIGRGAPLVEAPDSAPDRAAKTQFPIVDGVYAITKTWSITLGGPFQRRVEDGSLILWRPCLTLFFTAMQVTDGGMEARRRELRAEVSKNATDVVEETRDGIAVLAYRLREDDEDERLPALYATFLAPSAQLMCAAYFDREADHLAARKALRSVTAR